jgi:hypothetical protein
MSRIHLRSNTLVLLLSLSAALAAAASSVGCSSSDSTAPGSAGKGGGSSSGGATASAGTSNGEAGDPAVGGETGEGGSEDTPTAGTAGTVGTAGSGGKATGAGGKAAGGSSGGGEAGEPGEGGAGGSVEEPDPRVAAAQARALALISGLSNARKCTTCHDVSYQGAGFFPNITPDVTTGIGSWDEEDIKIAIRDGKDKDGVTLCATMERYAFTDEQLSDLAIFLKHLPPISKKISGKCPSQ